MSPGYLRALGAHLVAGSWLDERTESGPAVLVSRAYAERYFPGRPAVGATLRMNGRTVTVAGVVGDIHLGALEQAPERAVFIDARQIIETLRAGAPRSPQTDRFFLTTGGTGIAFAACTTGDPLAIMADLRTIARDIDPRLAIDAAVPLERIVSGLTTRPRFYAALLSVFGAIAGFIAVIGIYGVLSYIVSQRTKEIGVRMALGAQRAAVLKLVLRRGALIVGIGVASGVACATALSGYLQGMLFGLKALDVGTFAAVAVAFAAIAMLAVYLPARRATAINPLEALRQE
jgi:putative ABC transport system permease protein